MGKKTRKAIKRLSKELDETREENRRLLEGLTQRMTEALERQAEANRALLDTLGPRPGGQDVREREDETESVPAQEDGDRREEPVEQDEKSQEPEATAAAERRARELGVDLSEVRGTGSGGRVLVGDVEEAAG